MNRLTKNITLLILLISTNAFSGTIPDSFEDVYRTMTDISNLKEQQTQLTEDDKAKANSWRLTEEDWVKYKSIMANSERGLWSPNLDPITVLGIEAKTEDERLKYAELLVQKEFERAEKELAFQRAYDLAWSRVFPGILPINTHGDPYAVAPVMFTGGRLALFIEKNCLTCDNLLDNVLKTGKDVDIYLTNSMGDDDFIRKWATEHKIDINRVKSRNITLNHDGGKWAELAKGKMPALMQIQNNEWRQVVIK